MIDFANVVDTLIERGILPPTLLIAHFGALVWSGWFRKGMAPVLALNLLVGAGVVLYCALYWTDLPDEIGFVWAFIAFECVVAVISLLAVLRVRVPAAAIWTIFTANALLTVGALAFMLTFRITRLI